jgi:hypothetical protein
VKLMYRVFVVLALWASAQVQAMTPEIGLWSNPAASGTGYNIDVQNNVMAVTIFSTDALGAPIYYLAAGPMVADNKFTGTMLRISNGQCFGCPYKAPVVTPDAPVSITFTSPTTASIVVNNGAPVPISRVVFGIDPTSISSLLGEWAIVYGWIANGDYFGERIQLKTTTTTGGVTQVSGSRPILPTTTAVVTLGADGFYTMRVSAVSSPYDVLYRFKLSDFNTIEGTRITVTRDTTNNVAGNFTETFYGSRIRSATSVITGSGPGLTTRAARLDANGDLVHALAPALSAIDGSALPAGIDSLAAAVEGALVLQHILRNVQN